MKKAMLELLDRPGGRRALGWIATVYGQQSLKGFRVFYEDGVWIHRYPGPHFMAHEKIMVPKDLPSDPEDPAYYVHGDPSTFGQAIEDIGHYLPQPGDVVIDVGAGKGTLTAALAHFVGAEGTVLAVEAHPRQFRCLEAVCEYNGLEQVVPENCAATDEEIELVIEDGGNPDENAVSTSGPGIRVKGTTLDHLIDVHDLEVVDLLCMNIEGAERQAVLGMAQSVGKIRRVAIACHDFRADEEGDESMRTKQAVTDFLVQHGFSIVEGDTARYGAAADDWVAATNAALLPS
jgi:FkbM family methyltransferase